ncbi:MlaA family lipoprotein [Fluviicoccus keumensis]|nr:VacJ family lipoprotein [Fluviicoccus keumensis]
MKQQPKRILAALLLAASVPVAAFADAAPAPAPANPDPWQGMNRKVYAFNKSVDTWFFKPVAKGYRAVTPQLVDDSITRFFLNLEEPLHMVNNGLQGKAKASVQDLGRLVVNTATSLGFADLASRMGLPRHDEDFGQTLGYWGVKPGPYVVLPFLGPSDIRDGASLPLDAVVNPRNLVESNSANAGLFVLDKVDFRADLIPFEKIIEGDEYLLMRDLYLQRRDFLVHDGKVKDDFLDDVPEE